MSEREKNAAIMRQVVAELDIDRLEAFLAQKSRADVAEWLIAQMPIGARRIFLQHQLATYASELAPGASA